MKELVVISGKGGTGKTSLVGAFAALAPNAVLADCDVDAADLYLILQPSIRQTGDFVGGKQATIIPEKCIGCRKCENYCRFDAITFDGPANDVIAKTCRVDPISCEGCKVCCEVCPADAVKFEDCVNGQWFISATRFGPMVHARLGIAAENSGKLVTLIRRQAKQIARQQGRDLIIVDGSPGIGCPVIASITAADLVLVVTEPTLSGKHDLQRAAQLTANFKIPTLVCINKADINPVIAKEIADDAGRQGLKVIGNIRYDKAFTQAQIKSCSVMEYTDGTVVQEIRSLWQNIINIFNGKLMRRNDL